MPQVVNPARLNEKPIPRVICAAQTANETAKNAQNEHEEAIVAGENSSEIVQHVENFAGLEIADRTTPKSNDEQHVENLVSRICMSALRKQI